MTDILQTLSPKPNENIPALQAGDTVRVHVRIVEGDHHPGPLKREPPEGGSTKNKFRLAALSGA